MALQTFTVRDALNLVISGLTPLATDPRLDSTQQAAVSQLIQGATLLEGALRANGTLPPGQQAKVQAVLDNITILGPIEAALEGVVGIGELYTYMDLAWDAATTAVAGQVNFQSDISSRG